MEQYIPNLRVTGSNPVGVTKLFLSIRAVNGLRRGICYGAILQPVRLKFL